ncbi:MAG: hypothetical protein H6720_17855 [Sandaracinus sp.]|nr:hypothetical protein [Sandaracinus sp.]
MHPRLVTEHACVAITRRTSFRKAFLSPWAGGETWDAVGQVFAYAAGLAQRATGVEVHQIVLAVTHHHTSMTPRGRELAEATRVLHRTTSRALKRLLLAHGYEAPEAVWDSRSTHWTTLVDAGAVASRLVYDDVNAVAAGWVAHPLDVAFGQHLGFEHWKAGGLVVPRPEGVGFGAKAPKEIELRLTPPIALWRQFEGDLDAMVAFLEELRSARLVPRSVRGAAAMAGLHPWDEPSSSSEEQGLVPSFAVTPGEAGRALRIQCAGEVRGHRKAHRLRIEAWKGGDRTSPFPAGSLWGHVFLGMELEAPVAGAVLTAPHISREEAEAELVEKQLMRARFEEERRARTLLREERRERARRLLEDDALEQTFEEEMRRIRVVREDPLHVPKVVDPVRREVKERVRTEGAPRVIVLRSRVVMGRLGGRGSNDPPE